MADAEPDAGADADAVLKARARELARPLDDVDAAGRTALLVLRAGDLRIGVALERVLRVAPPGPTARVPGRGHALAGLRAVGADLVPVAGADALLGAPRGRGTDDAYAVLVEHRDGILGLLADVVEGVAEVDPGSLSDVPDDTTAVRGVAPDGVLIVDIDVLLADPRLTTVADDPRNTAFGRRGTAAPDTEETEGTP